MTIVILGEVQEAANEKLVVLDIGTGESHDVVLEGDLVCSKGTTGAFIGKKVGSEFRCNLIEARKFLNPVFEEDLLKEAGKVNLFKLVADPFPKYFNTFKQEELNEFTESETDPTQGTLQEGSPLDSPEE